MASKLIDKWTVELNVRSEPNFVPDMTVQFDSWVDATVWASTQAILLLNQGATEIWTTIKCVQSNRSGV